MFTCIKIGFQKYNNVSKVFFMHFVEFIRGNED